MKIAIIGGGITGLTAAWRLQTLYGKKAEIVLFEKSSRLGGWIQTIDKEGFLFEQGPHSFRTAGAGLATLRLIEELGMQDQVIMPSPKSCQRYLCENGKLSKLPSTMFSYFSSWGYLIGKALWRDAWAPVGVNTDESIADFFERRVGKEMTDRMIDPLTIGIYAGDMHQLSMRSCFPSFFDAERRYGSLLRGALLSKKKSDSVSPWISSVKKQTMLSFRQGMESLVRTLTERLTIEVNCNSEIIALDDCKEGVELKVLGGSAFAADRVISTVPANTLTKLFPQMPQVPSSSVIVVNLGYRKNVLRHEGFGYLIPSKENENLLGVIWDSSVFPEQNQCRDDCRLTVMVSGEYGCLEDVLILKMVKESLERHLKIFSPPDAWVIKRAYYAIPQYPVNYADDIKEFKKNHSLLRPYLHFLGTAFHGVSINECIASGLNIS